MATVDYGMGEMEIRCTYRTLSIYEQEFRDKDGNPADMIADVMGKVSIPVDEGIGKYFEFNEDGSVVAVIKDYTATNWNAQKRALWAMLRTAERIAKKNGEKHDRVPSFEEWDDSLLECEPDLDEISLAVASELQRGLFRAGAAASGKTSEGEA